MNAADFAAWLARERGALLRFCARYVRDPRDAEDAVSDVVQRLLRVQAAPDDARTFAFTAARNACLNRIRDAAKRDANVGLPSGFFVSQTGPLTRLLNAENEQTLQRALAELTDSTRELLLLRYGEDLTRDEIAAITGLSASVVKSRLFEGLESLRKKLA